MDQLAQQVERYCRKQGLLHRNERVLVALSGGADSVCLLYLLRELAPAWDLELAAAHLHHGLRGREADGDLAFVQQLCQRLEIPLYEKRVDVKQIAQKLGCSLETAGRQQRYDFLQSVQKQEKFDVIATAHQKNDQAETVLMHVLRGSGGRGMAGIPPRRGMIIRPLLDVSRTQIEQYLEKNGLAYRMDSSNTSRDMTRNKVRLELLPLLKREYNPNIVQALCRTAESLRQQQMELDRQAACFFQTAVSPTKTGWKTEGKSLLAAGQAVGKLVLCQMARQELEWPHIQAIWNLLKQNQTGKGIDLPGNRRAVVSYGHLILQEAEHKPLEFCYQLQIGEKQYLAELGLWAGVQWTLEDTPEQEGHTMWYAGEPICIRSRKPGDRIRTGGMDKKVKKLLIDEKIPREERDRCPVVQVGKNIVWVYGVRHADKGPEGAKKITIWIKERETCIRT